MENDHKNIRELCYLLDNYSKDSLATMKSLHLNDEIVSEFPDHKLFSLFHSILSLSMTYCLFQDLKPLSIVRGCPNLKKIDLTGSQIPSIKSLIPLGKLQYLEELNLSKSSIILDRYYLLSYLLHGHTIIATAPRKRKIQRAFPLSKSILCQNKPAPVPRACNFPRLQIVNCKVITEEEVESVQPRQVKPPSIVVDDPVLSKVKRTNDKILRDKEQFGSFRTLMSSATQASLKPRVDTFERINKEKSYPTCASDDSPPASSSSSVHLSSSSSSDTDWIAEDPYKLFVPKSKEEAQEFLTKCKAAREAAEKPIEKKLYTFHEVCSFMYGRLVQETHKVNSVCEVLRIVNGVKQNNGISEQEVFNRLKNPKNLTVEDIYEFQQILLLDDEIRSMRLQSAYFEWWIKKIEKKHIEFAEHKAILALHRNRVFNNPLLGAAQEKSVKKRVVIKDRNSEKDSSALRNVKRIVDDAEPQYYEANFAKYFDPKEIKQGETYFIKPIMSFEESIGRLHSQIVERERHFENLSFGDKVLVKLEKLKKNIKEREGLRDRLNALFEQVTKLKKKFQENQAEYLYNIYEKKLDRREVLKNHDYRRFELPTFVFPVVK